MVGSGQGVGVAGGPVSTPSPARWLTDATQVAADLADRSTLAEPVLVGHLATLALDVPIVAGLCTAWGLTPGAVAAVATLGGLILHLVGKAAAAWLTRARVQPLPAPGPGGRHQSP